MSSPAAAIAWEFRWRHRWGLIVLSCYIVALAIIRVLIVHLSQRVSFHDAETFALLVVVPLASTFMYFLAVFSFGLSGDFSARQSIFPSRMFTLPVTTSALAGLPMLYGATAMMTLWILTRLFALWPDGYDVPWIWPGILAAILLAWTQALTWMSYPLRGLRVIITVLWLAMIDTVVMIALQYKASELRMLLLLAPQIPLAYVVARYAVGRARRGEVGEGGVSRLAAIPNFVSRKQENFTSAASAQFWLEWRTHGGKLPALVAILLPFEFALLFLFRDTASLVYEILFAVLLTPPFMAAFVAATVSKTNPQSSDSYGLSSFFATRPLSDAQLIAAKLKASLWSTLATWLLVLLTIPLALILSKTSPVIGDAARQMVKIFGVQRAIAIAVLGIFLFVASTWKQLIKNLYIGMSGREWLIKGSVFIALSVLALAVPLDYWLTRKPGALAALWNAIPYMIALLVCVKLSTGAWILIRMQKGQVLSNRMLIFGAICWSVAAIAFYCVLVWIFTTLLIRSYFLGLIAILAIPLARLSAAPLALAWNRHRGPHLLQNAKAKVIAPLLMIVTLPALLAFVDATHFYIHNANNGSIISSGEHRKYLLYVPKSYDKTRSTPLVISMHGAGGWPTQQMELSQWNELAERERFIVVYPAGIDGFGPRVWRVDHGPGLMKDVRFISDLIDQIELNYNIDRARIYANGLSNGGGMAFVLSCTLSDRIAAIGMVGAAQTLPWNWCVDKRTLPMIDFHGLADPVMPYEGGSSWISSDYFPSVRGWAAKWAKRNHCHSIPIESKVTADVSLREYGDCADDAAVDLYTIVDGGHTWPGGGVLPQWFVGRTTNSINATSLMWKFFQQHPLHHDAS